MNKPVNPASIERALALYQASRNAEADALCRRLLAENSISKPDALHLLGAIAMARDDAKSAADYFRQAIELHPNWAEAHGNLGIALMQMGKLEESITAHRRAVAINPKIADLFNNLGNALSAGKDFAEAIAAYRQAIELQPDANFYFNLGNALQASGNCHAAIEAYDQALAKRQGAEAHNNLGLALQSAGKTQLALAQFIKASSLNPNFFEAHFNAGNIYRESGDWRSAAKEYRLAVAIRPESAEAHFNLGFALSRRGMLDAAIESYRTAIQKRPDYAEAFNNLGSILVDVGDLDGAVDAYRNAMSMDPCNEKSHSNLILAMLYHPKFSKEQITAEGRRWNDAHARPVMRTNVSFGNERNPDRRLRIGYVSPDFRDHVVGRNILPLLEKHDHETFEIFCYCNGREADSMTQRFHGAADRWRDVAKISDDELAGRIGADQIDIVVDLAVHTPGNRLLAFARRPAPVQATFAGYPGGTGMETMDYRLSDPYLDPVGADWNDVEKVLRLPHSFWCYDPLDCADIQVNPLPAMQNGFVTFGCLNSFCKINEVVLDLWAGVLDWTSNSRLLLLAPGENHRRRVMEFFAGRGIDQARIEFVPFQPRRQYLELYHRIDLGLDTFPYNGHTTSLDSLWMGVPVVALVGDRPVARAGWSQASNLKMTELAATSKEGFIVKASELAGDLPKLAGIRAGLRKRMEESPLMDAVGFAREIENAYRTMWRDYCNRA